MNWHLYSLSTDKLQTMVVTQQGKIGDAVPALNVFQSGIKTAYTRYWESRLTSLYQVVVTRNRYVQLLESVIKGHNETFKMYSGIEATLSQRSKLLREIVDESAIVNVEDVLTTRAQRLTNCNRQAMAIIQRVAALQDIVSWIRNNHVSDSTIMGLAEEYERAVLLGKLTCGELLTLYADIDVAMDRLKVLSEQVESATGEDRQTITEPLRQEINWRSFQRNIISATKEHCLSPQLTVLQHMLESASVERNRSNSAFTASVKQSDRIKMTLLSEPQHAFEFPVNVSFDNSMVWVELADGRIVGAPLKWFPKLREADRLERDQYQMTPVSLIWRTLDTQIHMDDLFDGDNNPLYPIDDIDRAY
ncbi:TPA: DUF2442 domain-containing protein [Escherichia coli]|nr:DUF2442 domain-containing protein [Escherichia coli]HBA9582209.1 DUF2442 domain-containing protein [Escherichia coli]HBA9586327.1 DUF2442 domain-containing protein [Escherichia coli]